MADGINSAKKRIAAYAASRPHRLSARKGQKKIRISKAPPLEIALLAGEMLYQMRSALDHLTFEIIGSNVDAADNPKWRKRCQFPIHSVIPESMSVPLPKSQFTTELPGISDKAFAVIEAMQPYNAKREAHTFLLFLDNLSNIDKHRHLNLMKPRVRQSQEISVGKDFVNGIWRMLERGSSITTSLMEK
jgi:hypothetical protein